MSRYRLSVPARRDLNEIWNYIARDSVDAASRWLDELLAGCEFVARNPHAGHRREQLTTRAVRFWPIDKYVIIYRPDARPVEIVRVKHGAQLTAAFFRRGL